MTPTEVKCESSSLGEMTREKKLVWVLIVGNLDEVHTFSAYMENPSSKTNHIQTKKSHLRLSIVNI